MKTVHPVSLRWFRTLPDAFRLLPLNFLLPFLSPPNFCDSFKGPGDGFLDFFPSFWPCLATLPRPDPSSHASQKGLASLCSSPPPFHVERLTFLFRVMKPMDAPPIVTSSRRIPPSPLQLAYKSPLPDLQTWLILFPGKGYGVFLFFSRREDPPFTFQVPDLSP